MAGELHWSSQALVPVLSVLLWLPALAAMGLHGFGRSDGGAFRLALAAILAEMAATVYLLHCFDAGHGGMQLAERWNLAGLNYHLGVDGLSLLFLPLVACLGLLVLLHGRDGEQAPPRAYCVAVLAYQAALIGLLVSQDMLLFWLGTAAETAVALHFLLRWRMGVADAAVARCVQLLGGAVLLLLAAVLLMGWRYAETYGVWSFDLADLAGSHGPPNEQTAVLFLILFAVALRMPLFPLHGWLAPIVQHAGPLAVAPVFLAGVKTGVYTLMRWPVPLLPEAVNYWDAYLVPLSVAGVFYGALLALVQLHLSRLLAFAVVSHGSALLLGVLTLDREGFAGTLLMAINAGVASAGLLLVCGQVQRRTHTLLMPRLGGLFDQLPALGVAFIIAASTLMAMPGTPGFDAAHFLLEGTLEVHEWVVTVALAFGTVLTAGFLLWAFQRTFLGRRRCPRQRPDTPATPSELIMAVLLSAALLAGFYTHPWLELIDASLPGLVKDYPAPLDR